jgi:hypothetical protein
MAWTLCTSGAAISKAGVNVNSTIVTSGSTLANWSNEAEALACSIARSDVVSNFSGLTDNGKQIFQEFCSSHIAQKIIGYEPEAIGSFSSTFRINVLENNINTCKTLIKEDKQKTYLAIT